VKLEDDNNLEPKNGDIVGSSPAPLMQALFIHHRPFRHGSGNRTLVCTLVIMYRFLGTFTHTQVSNFFGSCSRMVGTLNSFICSLLKNGGISWPSLGPNATKNQGQIFKNKIISYHQWWVGLYGVWVGTTNNYLYIQNPCQGEFFMCFLWFFLPNNKDVRNPTQVHLPAAFLF
jgi:hypothetical protein